MASNDQTYRAGETKGRAEEKTKEMTGTIGDKAQQAKDKTYEAGQATKEWATDKKDQSGSYVSDKARAAKEKTSEVADSTKQKASETAHVAGEKAQYGKEKTGGILGQTGEKVKSMAQGAADAVKSTFGMAQNEDDVEEERDSVTYTAPGTKRN